MCLVVMESSHYHETLREVFRESRRGEWTAEERTGAVKDIRVVKSIQSVIPSIRGED